MEGNAVENITDFRRVLSNGTNHPLDITEGGSPIITSIKVCIGVTGVIGNMLVVIIVCKHKKLFRRQIKSVYIINQSFLDGISSAILIPMALLHADLMSDMDDFSAEMYCKFWLSQVLLWGLMMSSTYNLVAISIERYLAVAHPIWHKMSFTSTKSRVSMVAIWLFGLSYLSPIVVSTSRVVDGVCYRAYFYPTWVVPWTLYALWIVVSWLLPLFLHCVCYCRIIVILRMRIVSNTNAPGPSDPTPTDERAADLRGSTQTPGTSNNRAQVFPLNSVVANTSVLVAVPEQTTTMNALESERQRRSEITRRNVIKTFALVTACYFICWTPHKIFIIMYGLGLISTFDNFYQATVILVFINCCINPFIYIAKFDAFKKAVLALVR